ncbi:MAG TPA: biotin--[acetyl-CoA-carboxylase] ligase [Acidimicrobiia bacterium]|nr:biotin--[acetyl-CoA-carboxylase] ligase [Acidimicrobiia bacterium]
MATPFTVHHLEVVASTQDEARARFRAAPVLVTARRQSSGRGRGGAMWQTAPRAVAASLAWVPAWPPESLPRLTLVAGLAALDVLGSPISLKWPNDLVRGDAKAGGILTEHAHGLVVTGLGINLYWPDPPDGIIAVHDDDPGPDAGGEIAAAWAGRVLERVESGPEAWGRDEYRVHCSTLGRRITWDPDGAGVARDVAPDGGLVVETAGGLITIDSGVVRMVRPAGETDTPPLP